MIEFVNDFDMEITEKFNEKVKTEIQFHWDDYMLDENVKEDLGSDFDFSAWCKQNRKILDTMFDDVETGLAEVIADYFGVDVHRVYLYHNDQRPVFQLSISEDMLISRLKEFDDEIDGIEEYNGWYNFYVSNNNSTNSMTFGDYVQDRLSPYVYGKDPKSKRILSDIIEIYMMNVDFSVYQPSPEFVEYLESLK